VGGGSTNRTANSTAAMRLSTGSFTSTWLTADVPSWWLSTGPQDTSPAGGCQQYKKLSTGQQQHRPTGKPRNCQLLQEYPHAL
jgi:hypothetical protein